MVKEELIKKISLYLDDDIFPELIKRVVRESLKEDDDVIVWQDVLLFFENNKKLIDKLK